MGSEGSWFPESTSVDTRSSRIEWEPVEWADEGAFASADHSEPAPGQRRFYTIAIRRGRVPTSDIASVAVLGVDRDLEIGIETRFAAEFDDGEWSLRDHDGIPASVCQRPRDDSTIPDGRRDWFRKVLERAHQEKIATDGAGFERASQIRADGGTITSTSDPEAFREELREILRRRRDRGNQFVKSCHIESALESDVMPQKISANMRELERQGDIEVFSQSSGGVVWEITLDDREIVTDGGSSESELVDRAVREATDLVDAGDALLVAVDCVVDDLELEHRRDDVRERVREQTAGDRRIVTDGGLIDACPKCDSGNVTRRTLEKFLPDRRFLCRDCRHEFADAVEREPKTGGQFSPLARKLMEAEPEDLATDGGRPEGCDAFLAEEAHFCDICARAFETFPELANHSCRPGGGRR